MAVFRARSRSAPPLSDPRELDAAQRRRARGLLPVRQAGSSRLREFGPATARTSVQPVAQRALNSPRFARSLAKNRSAAVSPRRSTTSKHVREHRGLPGLPGVLRDRLTLSLDCGGPYPPPRAGVPSAGAVGRLHCRSDLRCPARKCLPTYRLSARHRAVEWRTAHPLLANGVPFLSIGGNRPGITLF